MTLKVVEREKGPSKHNHVACILDILADQGEI